MDRPVHLLYLELLPYQCCHGGSLSLKPNEQIGWRFIRNDIVLWMRKAMASPLPIHHRWCIADKLLGSNKLLLRGWPRWWKQKLPHGHGSAHSPLFSIQQSELVSVQGNSYQHYYLLGVLCVHWQKRTNTQFVSRHWVKSPSAWHKHFNRQLSWLMCIFIKPMLYPLTHFCQFYHHILQ